VVDDLVRQGRCSERKACRLAGVARSTKRYTRRQRVDEGKLRKAIRRLADRYRRYGYRRIAALLRRKGWLVNVKRVHRIWKLEGLGLRRKRPKRRAYGPTGEVLNKAERPNHVWTYDFIEDRTERGGKLRILTVLDEFTRECLAIRVERSIGSQRVIDTLEWLFLLHGAPTHLRSDNGPEFIAKALREWLAERGARTLYITPGSPWENPYIESFNGSLRDECLNMHVFTNGRHAQEVAEQWRNEYNEFRPHSSLNYETPAEFAAHWRNSGRPTASFRCANAEIRGLSQEHRISLTPDGT
jgi:transposase InsO family protein